MAPPKDSHLVLDPHVFKTHKDHAQSHEGEGAAHGVIHQVGNFIVMSG